MILEEFLKDQELTYTAFAQSLGVTPEAVRLWLTGQRRPRADLIKKIERETNGKVQPNDFFEAP